MCILNMNALMAIPCTYFNVGICRSCEWIDRDYPTQLSAKADLLREKLAFFGNTRLQETTQTPVASPLLGFRNRAKMTVTGTVQEPVIGLIGEGNLDEGRELLSCPIHHPRLNELIGIMPEFIRQFGLVPYRIQERSGELKGLIAFYSPLCEQMYLRFVLRSQESLHRIRKLIPSLQARFPALVCISANLQPIPHAILEGREEILLTERSYIDHQIGSLRLKLVPQAFVQTHPEMATALYQTAAKWITEARPKAMLELFSGQGAFSFFSAPHVERLLGIELNPEAVKTANDTAEKLGLSQLEFRCSDATALVSDIDEFQPDLILANPPRSGLRDGIKFIERQRPSHFIYSSCSVDSLAEDLEKLAGIYTLKRLQIFDMFPHTHV